MLDESAAEARFVVVRPNGDRRVLAFEPVTRSSSAVWGQAGKTVIATDSILSVWLSRGEDVEPERLAHPGAAEFVALDAAPDDRYIRVMYRGTLDVPNYSHSVYDLTAASPLSMEPGCNGSQSLFRWHRDGPAAVQLNNTCMGLGVVEEHTVSYVASDETRSLASFSVNEEPAVSISPSGDLILFEYEDRWQLRDLAGRTLREALTHSAQLKHAWSQDGLALYRVEGDRLTRYDTNGDAGWETDLGIFPASITPSPVGGQILVMSGDCGGGSCVVLIDDADGSARFDQEPRGSASWSPTGDALIVGPVQFETEGMYGLRTLGSGQTRPLTTWCQAPKWSPDGEMFICEDRCDSTPVNERARQLRLFDRHGGFVLETACAIHREFLWSPNSDLVALNLTDVGETPADDRHRIRLIDLHGGEHELGPGLVQRGFWRPGDHDTAF